jgi:V8-like Glu-specific endopeptidase
MPSRPEPRRRHAFAPRVEGAEARLLLSTVHIDNRVPVADTTVYPYNAIVQITVLFPNGDIATGSGAMIDATHVLTAAHVIYSGEDGGWPTAIVVTPGQAGVQRPFDSYAAASETIYTDYALHETRNNRDFSHDVGMITLATPVVPGVGALGQVIRPTAFFRGATLTTSGYPGDRPAPNSPLRGTVMVTATGRSTRADSHLIAYTIPTSGGQSGSPLYENITGGTFIAGVVSFGVPAGVNPTFNNGAVRLTPVLHANLTTWGVASSVPNPLSVFAAAVLPRQRSTIIVTVPYTPQGLMHVISS